MTSPITPSASQGTTGVNPDDEILVTLEQLEAQAEAVRTLTDDFNAATEAELDAEVLVFDRALRAVAPVRRALCEPIAKEYVVWIGISRDSSVTYFPKRGLELAGDYGRKGDYNDLRGPYEGSALVLWADGTLGELEYSGRWTLFSGEADREKCRAVPITAREALQRWHLNELLGALASALNEQAERAKPAEKDRANARAARLAAVATLAR